jgi:hypothetical protein
VQNFVRRKSRERQLKNRLHAIWFVLQVLGSYYGSEFTNLTLQVLHPDGH